MRSNPTLVVLLTKSWSEEARAAALAARQAKDQGVSSRQAAAIAKNLVRKGRSEEEAVKESVQFLKDRKDKVNKEMRDERPSRKEGQFANVPTSQLYSRYEKQLEANPQYEKLSAELKAENARLSAKWDGKFDGPEPPAEERDRQQAEYEKDHEAQLKLRRQLSKIEAKVQNASAEWKEYLNRESARERAFESRF